METIVDQTLTKSIDDVFEFSIEGYIFKYKCSLKPGQANASWASIAHIEFINPTEIPGIKSDDIYYFEEGLPANKTAFMKLIGAWARATIWKHVTRDYKFPDDVYGSQDFRMPTTDKVLRKQKSYTYLRSSKLGRVLGGVIYNTWVKSNNLQPEQMKEIERVVFRMRPLPSRDNTYLNLLFVCCTTMHKAVWNLLISDLAKYNVSMCKYICSKLIDIGSGNLSKMVISQYIDILKSSPDVVRKCNYGFEWSLDSYSVTELPINRWQWFCLRAWDRKRDSLINSGGSAKHDIYNIFLSKLSKTDISIWHYYKKAYHISAPYSFARIEHMVNIVFDGARMYSTNKNNEYGIPFVPIEGSPMRMLRNAIYNHRSEQAISKKRKLDSDNYLLPRPPIKLPEWIENIRLKTAHDMITAGIECEHCIGGYVDSNDIFVREGNVCAQIYRRSLDVGQCYDYKDSISKLSEDLKKRLGKSLDPLKELIKV